MLVPPPKLVAVGDNCLDVYLTRGVMTVGGNALNVAAHWRHRGWPARYFGAVGDDIEGGVVLEAIETLGLATGDVERLRGETGVTLLRDDAGDRRFLLEALGVGKDYMPSDAHYRIIAAADWVHLGTNANANLIRRLVADRVPFSVDVSTAHFALPLDGVPLLFASGPDDPTAPLEPLIESFHEAGVRMVAVTCGSRGATFSDGGALLHAAATPIPVVDTCGAGDSLIAAFLAAFCWEQRDAGEALRDATEIAAQTCRYIGGFLQTPRPIPAALLAKHHMESTG